MEKKISVRRLAGTAALLTAAATGGGVVSNGMVSQPEIPAQFLELSGQATLVADASFLDKFRMWRIGRLQKRIERISGRITIES